MKGNDSQVGASEGGIGDLIGENKEGEDLAEDIIGSMRLDGEVIGV